MNIAEDCRQELIVFADQEEGTKGLRLLALERIEHALVSTLAVVVPAAAQEEVCSLLLRHDVLIGGHFPYLADDQGQDLMAKAAACSAGSRPGEYLEGITLSYVAPCLADERKIRLIACLSRDVSGLLPYLNATMRGASYNKKAAALSYHSGAAMINLYSGKVTVARADDIVHAWGLLGELQDTINDVYRNREIIRPRDEQRVKPGPFQVYGWLPRSNCGACGEKTCLAFAARLLQGEHKPEDCPPLREEPRWAENRETLRQLVETLGL